MDIRDRILGAATLAAIIILTGFVWGTTHITDTYINITGDLLIGGAANISNINNIYYVQAGNTSDIQTQIDAAPAGGAVVIPPGSYDLCSKQINVTKPIQIRCIGNPTLNFSCIQNGTYLLNISADNVSIQHCTLLGNSANVSAIWVNAKHVEILGNTLRDFGQYGIRAEANTEYAIFSGNTIINMSLDNIEGYAGIFLAGGRKDKIINNYVERAGIPIVLYGTEHIVTSNHLVGGGWVVHGIIQLQGSMSITDNLINLSGSTTLGQHGIYLSGQLYGPITDTLISGNTIIEPYGHGMKMDNVYRTVISDTIVRLGNTPASATQSCFSVGPNLQAHYVSILNSQCYNPKSVGIATASTNTSFITIDGVLINGSGSSDGVRIQSPHTILSNSVIMNSYLSGVWVRSTADKSVVTGNKILNSDRARSGVAGIEVNAPAGVIITNNYVIDDQAESTTTYGIDLMGNDFICSNNLVVNTSLEGIRVYSWTENISGGIVTGNYVLNPGNSSNNAHGMQIRQTGTYAVENVTVVGNTVKDTRSSKRLRSCIHEGASNCDYNIITANICYGNTETGFVRSGSNTQMYGNIGSSTTDNLDLYGGINLNNNTLSGVKHFEENPCSGNCEKGDFAMNSTNLCACLAANTWTAF